MGSLVLAASLAMLPRLPPTARGAGAVAMSAPVHSSSRAAEIEGLADQVWQLRTDGFDIHVTVIRELEAELALLQLEEACDVWRDSSAAVWDPAVRGYQCDISHELRERVWRRAAASLEQTAVPPVMGYAGVDAPTALQAAVNVVTAMRVYLTFSLAAYWACSSAVVAGSLTDALRGLQERGRRGEILAPLIGKALARCFGANYVPRLGFGSISQARSRAITKYLRFRPGRPATA